MADVFVSYKAEDRKRVAPLIQALETDGLSVWWDAHIGGGDEWRDQIQRELDNSKCVIVVWSKRSIGPDGHFVRDEATRAQRRHAYLPVRIDKVDPPLGFGETQALPLTGWHGERSDAKYQAVLAAVRHILGVEPSSTEPRSSSRFRITRRTALESGVAATVAVAGIGAWALLKLSDGAASDSIAVLPFANLSGDPGQAYLSDGISEELRSALSRVAGLKVVGPTSSEAVRDTDAETAAEKLGVANILTGSVRRSPSVVRVSAQLINGENGVERWSESYDRVPGDAIKIQTDIAQNVARALSVALAGEAETGLTVGGTQNAAAQNLVLQAEEAIDEGTRAGTLRSIQLIDSALRLNPNYADAYARKSIYVNRLGSSFASGSAELARFRAQALELARKAVSLAPNLAGAHFALARVYDSNLEIASAATEYQRALRLAPGDARLIRRHSYFVARSGDPSEAVPLADKAIELDPLNPDSYENRVGALFDARRYAEALRFAEETKRKSPEMFDAPVLLGDCLQMLCRFREAQQQYSLGRPDQWERLTGEALLLARTGERGGAIGKLQRMQQLFGDAGSYQYGEVYTQLGDKDRAFAALERAWEIRDGGLMNLRNDPMLDPLRADPRYKALVKKLNFPSTA